MPLWLIVLLAVTASALLTWMAKRALQIRED
jgi:hypothetical protein